MKTHMRPKRSDLDDGAAFVGILLGIVLGAIYALLRIKQNGPSRRRDLTQFGAARAEVEMQARMNQAKAEAKARLERDD